MYIVVVGLVKVHKALIRVVKEALSVPFLMSVSEAFSVLFHLIKLCHTKALTDQA